MFETKKDKNIYALITVIITVPCFVLYCLSYENGGILNIDPIFALKLIPLEFALAYLTEIFVGSHLAVKFALKTIDPKEYKPMIVETAIVCATAVIMCVLMSFYYTIIYKGIFPGIIFNEPNFTLNSFLINFIPNLLQTITLNFPFAILSQLFFIQPLTRRIFKFYKTKTTK